VQHRIACFITALVMLVACPSALAASEQGDAGELPASAQDLRASAVSVIEGEMLDGSDVDLYRICLSGGGSFSASTVGGSEGDTQLFLFDAGGLGVYGNDDAAAGVKQSTLPAGHAFTPAAGGEYLLAVAPYDRDPLSSAGRIFPNRVITVGATDRGAGQPVSAWAGLERGVGTYAVTLAGTRSCDEVPPTVAIASPVDGTSVARGASVTVDYECADEGGSGLASCEGDVADGAPLDTQTLGTRTLTVTARDGAGNETIASASVEVVDAEAPSVSVAAPLDGATYEVGDHVAADYACADEAGGSGLAACSGDVDPGAAVDTASAGSKTFTVEGTDVAGNSRSVTVAYEVVEGEKPPPLYDFSGFAWPVARFPAVTRWIAGAPVRLRFSLGGDQGLDVVADGYPQVAVVDCGAGQSPEGGEQASTPWRRVIRYRARRSIYVLLWKTERRWAGSCRQLVLRLSDGQVARAEFRFLGNNRRR
jgi:hypothetical protein